MSGHLGAIWRHLESRGVVASYGVIVWSLIYFPFGQLPVVVAAGNNQLSKVNS